MSCHTEQLTLCSQQHIVTTVEDYVLRTEMSDHESQEEDIPDLILYFKPMSCLVQTSPHRIDEVWSVGL
jgi:hypothetical protein